MAAAWVAWSKKQNFTSEDEVAFAPFNRLTWYSSNNFTKPYPGDKTVMTPAQVEAKFGGQVTATGNQATRAGAPHLAGEID